MHEKIMLWMECKNYCIPLPTIRVILMEIQEDVCLNGGSREQASGLAQQFIEQVSAKLN
jgi:hypothetical protein